VLESLTLKVTCITLDPFLDAPLLRFGPAGWRPELRLARRDFAQ
jgi:hypothetical protein